MKSRILLTVALAALLTSVNAQNLPLEPTGISPLLVGEKAPELKLSNIDGGMVSISEIAAAKQTVLIFYRGGWCPYCNVHLAELQSIEQQILAAGYQIVAISPDSPENLKKSIDKNKLTYLLLSDSKSEAAYAFGIAFKAPDRYNDMLSKASANLNKDVLPVPAVFVLNKQGEILFEHINPDYKKRIKGTLLMAVLNELKDAEPGK